MDIWVRDLRTGRDRRLTSMPNAEMVPAWSPDGSRIAFTGSGGLFVVAASGGEPKSLNKGAVFGYPSWARDGSFLIVPALKPHSSRRREGVNYYSIVPLDGRPAALVVPQEHEPIGRRSDGAALSPDGRHLAFVRHGSLHVLPVGPDGRPDRSGAPAHDGAGRFGELGPAPISCSNIAVDRLKLVSLADGRTRGTCRLT